MKKTDFQLAFNLGVERDEFLVLEAVKELVRKFKRGCKVEAKFHMISLSGIYEYERLVQALGPICLASAEPQHKMPNYRKSYWKQLMGGFKLVIFLDPIQAFMPECYINLLPPDETNLYQYKGLLAGLGEVLPKLNCSKVEATLDIYHKEPQVLRGLYDLFRMCLVVPCQRETQMWTDDVTGARTMKIGDVRIYERGNKRDKEESGGWQEENIDRIRLERTVKRSELARKGIRRISDLQAPGFYGLNLWRGQLRYKFQHFIGLGMPKFYEKFQTNSFYEEKRLEQERVKNMYRNLREFTELDPIREGMRNAMILFDQEWDGIRFGDGEALTEIMETFGMIQREYNMLSI